MELDILCIFCIFILINFKRGKIFNNSIKVPCYIEFLLARFLGSFKNGFEKRSSPLDGSYQYGLPKIESWIFSTTSAS